MEIRRPARLKFEVDPKVAGCFSARQRMHSTRPRKPQTKAEALGHDLPNQRDHPPHTTS